MAAIPVYSSQLIAETGFTGTATLEIPAGVVCVVRDIDAVAGVGIGASVWAYDNAGVKFAANTFSTVTVTFALWSWRGRQVLEGPDFLHLSTDAALDIRASGYLLNAP